MIFIALWPDQVQTLAVEQRIGLQLWRDVGNEAMGEGIFFVSR